MLLNCGVGEDSWESLGLQGDPTSPFWRRSVLGVHWKDWCLSWNCNILATSCEELSHCKRLWWLEGLGQEEKGTTEDETAGWHHRLNGHEFEWTLGVGDGQGGLACCTSQVTKSRTLLSNWTELNWLLSNFIYKRDSESQCQNSLTYIIAEMSLFYLHFLLFLITYHLRDIGSNFSVSVTRNSSCLCDYTTNKIRI